MTQRACDPTVSQLENAAILKQGHFNKRMLSPSSTASEGAGFSSHDLTDHPGWVFGFSTDDTAEKMAPRNDLI